eukprot:CAMPEP_0204187412 /NCGR_PEP_ID=MMETSP0361-20130328/56787_1 /ASSEMBLY_ACC=CAM_ASM_000343 /TAXON_ID=268821 /ORGANISM="Scrippsiella Hangoei, Strain SHTV-5" /LENGTH=43 /DNA_ID= /DNA_START= /DNA_END= /DNA_ORIENTATION=
MPILTVLADLDPEQPLLKGLAVRDLGDGDMSALPLPFGIRMPR